MALALALAPGPGLAKAIAQAGLAMSGPGYLVASAVVLGGHKKSSVLKEHCFFC